MSDLSFLESDQIEYTNLLVLISDLLLHSFDVSIVGIVASPTGQIRSLLAKKDGIFVRKSVKFFTDLELSGSFWKDVMYRLLARFVHDGTRTGCDQALMVCAIMMLEADTAWLNYFDIFYKDFEIIKMQAMEFYHGLDYLMKVYEKTDEVMFFNR